jgi:hypothetical protein
MAFAYLSVVIGVVYVVPMIIKARTWRWIVRAVAFPILMMLPVTDEILGRYYFEHLCEKSGGVRVFKTVTLGPEYYFDDGAPRFINNKGKFDSAALDGKYEFDGNGENDVGKFVVIDETVYSIRDTTTGDVLGTMTWYFNRGGFLNNKFSPNPGGKSCGVVPGSYYDSFIRHVLKPADTPKVGLSLIGLVGVGPL